MGIVFKSGDKPSTSETDPLLGHKSKQNWCRRWKVLILLLFLLMLFFVAYFVLYDNSAKKKSSTLLKSVATINDDYFKKCAPLVTCGSNSKYRTANGSCNNLQNPTWGAAKTPFYRYMDPEFSDGVSKFRLQSDGSELPNARHLTLMLFQNKNVVCDHKNNQLLVPWGQFVAHDLAYSPLNSINSSFPAALDHCDDEDPPIECEATIRLSPDDPVFGKYELPFLKFMRLTTSSNYSCPLVPATVLNQNTHYMDASNVYGSDDELANELRLFEGGKLRDQKLRNEEYCPQDPSKISNVGNHTQVTIAFIAGDVNVNQNLAIALFQNLFLRFHNHIAGELQTAHPSWTDEAVYLETRRIVGAVVQVITYNDFLPIVLGEQYMDKYGLADETNYDPTIPVTLAQEMSSGAYRLLHNIIPAQFNYMSSNYTTYEVEEPSKLFLRPNSIIDNIDGFVRGLIESPGQEPGPVYNDLITNIVIESPFINTTGFDLLSYDIQRGRDVGLPPYTKARKLCGLPQPKSFEDLSDHIPLDKIDQLKSLYASVDDIDYFVGILLENRMNDSMIGPTGSCVIADSFYRIRNGDRFFYDVKGQPGSFTQDQINSLKKITLSHLICATTNVEHVHTDTFSLIEHIRMMRLKPNCETYKIDLTAW